MTGLAGSLTSMIAAPSGAWLRRRRDVSRGDPRDVGLDAAARRGFAQGITHSAARLGNAITPPLVAALIAWVTWRGSFVVLGVLSLAWTLVWGLYFRDSPADHPSITR